MKIFNKNKEKSTITEEPQTKTFEWMKSIDLHFNTIKADGRQMFLTLYYASLNDRDWTVALRDSDKIDSIKAVAIEYLDNGYDAIKVKAAFKNKVNPPVCEFIIRTSNVYMPLLDEKEEKALAGFDGMMGLGIIEVKLDSVRKESTIERLTDKLEEKDIKIAELQQEAKDKITELQKQNDDLSAYIDELEDKNDELGAQVQKSRESNNKAMLAGGLMVGSKIFNVDPTLANSLAGLFMGSEMPALGPGEQQDNNEAQSGRSSDEKVVIDWIKELNASDFHQLSVIIGHVVTEKITFDDLIKYIQSKSESNVSA